MAPESSRKRRATVRYRPDETVMMAVEEWIASDGDPPSAQELADKINERLGEEVTREQIYPLVREGKRRGYLLFCPPYASHLGQQMADAFCRGLQRQVRFEVFQCSARVLHDAAAKRVHAWLQDSNGANGEQPVEIGLGAGSQVRDTTRSLHSLLEADARCPDFSVYGLAPAGWSDTHPEVAPLFAAGYFKTAANAVHPMPLAECHGLDLGIVEVSGSESDADIVKFQVKLLDGLSAVRHSVVMLVGPSCGAAALPPFLRLRFPVRFFLSAGTAERLLDEWRRAGEASG